MTNRKKNTEFKNNDNEKYNRHVPKSIGFLVYLYGPVVFNFLVLGLTFILYPSNGPPFPILFWITIDEKENISPITININNKIILMVEFPIKDMLKYKSSFCEPKYNIAGKTIKTINPPIT